MKILKPLLLSAMLGASMGVFSTAAVSGECAEDKGRTCYGPIEAIDLTVELIREARHAIDNGNDTAGILNLIKSAKNMGKEINANDTVDRQRAKSASFLKKAKKAMKAGDNQGAHTLLLEAEKRYEGLKSLI
ncbi:MAG: hypothetical protein PSN04_06380 [Methyloprofundus sp.]|nr:hypothetical protein [Methyloprofundus sp.]